MDADEPGWPIFDDFFRTESEGRAAATVRRYAAVRGRLYAFLDTADMTLGLGTQPADLLEAERQFHTSGAFWTLFGPDELVCCLPSFVHDTWLPSGLADARAQVSLAGRLLTHLGQRPELDRQAVSCAMYEAQDAIARARRALGRRAEGPAEQPRMPDRFLQHPGDTW